MSEFDPYRPPPGFAEVNPYAAPEAELEPVPRIRKPTGYGLPPFSMDAVIRRAWEVFQREMGTTMAIVLGVGAILFGYEIAGNMIVGALAASHAPDAAGLMFTVAHALVRIVLQLWLTVGQAVALLKLARGQPTEFGDVFGGGRYLLRFIGASILCSLLFATIALVCAIPALIAISVVWSQGNAGAWALFALCAVAGLIGWMVIAVRFYQYTYILVDRDCDVVESLTLSYELTRGHVFELVGLWLIAALIAIAGFLLCVVGLLFTVPLSMLLASCTYALLASDAVHERMGESYNELEFLD